jgi:hypothetical protein
MQAGMWKKKKKAKRSEVSEVSDMLGDEDWIDNWRWKGEKYAEGWVPFFFCLELIRLFNKGGFFFLGVEFAEEIAAFLASKRG